MTTIELRKTQINPPKIKQSRGKRDWMDATYNKHAYQCRPMTVANVYGWELSLPCEVRVVWRGGNNNVEILSGSNCGASAGIIGMVTFSVGWRFKTEPGYSIQMGGSPNLILPGAQALSGIIPTDWWSDEFLMNWMITDQDREIVFPEGFPFMFFTVVQNSVVENAQLKLDSSVEDRGFINSRIKYGKEKMQRNIDKPWTWTKGIKTGLDADGNQIGPTFMGLPKLHELSEEG